MSQNLSSDLHEAYVKSMLQGGRVVKTRRGHHVQFQQHGAGFMDWAKGMWGRAKTYFHKVAPTILDQGKDILKTAVNAGLNRPRAEGETMKDMLKAGFKAGFNEAKSEVKDRLRDNKGVIAEHLANNF